LFFGAFDLLFAFAFFDEGKAQDAGDAVVGDEAAETEGCQADDEQVTAGGELGRETAFAAGEGSYQAKKGQVGGDNHGVGGVGGLFGHRGDWGLEIGDYSISNL
jgi:hypothetical protein